MGGFLQSAHSKRGTMHARHARRRQHRSRRRLLARWTLHGLWPLKSRDPGRIPPGPRLYRSEKSAAIVAAGALVRPALTPEECAHRRSSASAALPTRLKALGQRRTLSIRRSFAVPCRSQSYGCTLPQTCNDRRS